MSEPEALGIPYFNYSIIYPQTLYILIIKAPALSWNMSSLLQTLVGRDVRFRVITAHAEKDLHRGSGCPTKCPLHVCNLPNYKALIKPHEAA